MAIGVFDSGVGGLSVLKQLIKYLPNEHYIYLGDTARVPYGNKSVSTVQHYSRQATEFFLDNDVKLIVVACNTASALAIESIQKVAKKVPVVEMIKPASTAASKSTKNSRIGVIGTRATINSEAYTKEILKHDAFNNFKVFGIACPLFVPLVEEGMIENPATMLIANEYLNNLKQSDIDTLVLGCTHYPFLQNLIQEILPNVKLIDTGEYAALEVKKLLESNGNLEVNQNYQLDFYLTDTPYTFTDLAEKMLGFKIEKPKKVDLD